MCGIIISTPRPTSSRRGSPGSATKSTGTFLKSSSTRSAGSAMSLGKILRLPNTLAFRLTLWYAGIFALSSCVAFLLFYAFITSVLQERTDQELLGQAQRFSTLLAGDGIGAVNNSAVIEAQAAGEKKVFFRLLNLTGEAFSSSNMSYWKDINVDVGAIEQLLRGSGPILETITISNRSDEVRILYAM